MLGLAVEVEGARELELHVLAEGCLKEPGALLPLREGLRVVGGGDGEPAPAQLHGPAAVRPVPAHHLDEGRRDEGREGKGREEEEEGDLLAEDAGEAVGAAAAVALAGVGVAAALAGEVDGAAVLAVDLVHEADVVEAELVPLPDRLLVVPHHRVDREQVVERRERLRPVVHD